MLSISAIPDSTLGLVDGIIAYLVLAEISVGNVDAGWSMRLEVSSDLSQERSYKNWHKSFRLLKTVCGARALGSGSSSVSMEACNQYPSQHSD